MKQAEDILQSFYYHDPDELGEDAFKPLSEDEVDELHRALYKDLSEMALELKHVTSGTLANPTYKDTKAVKLSDIAAYLGVSENE